MSRAYCNLKGWEARKLSQRYEAGESLNNIARDTGIDREVVRRVLLAEGVTMRTRGYQKEAGTRGYPVGRKRSDLDRSSRAARFAVGAAPVQRAKIWCSQCERSVVPDEAATCRSQWCKAAA